MGKISYETESEDIAFTLTAARVGKLNAERKGDKKDADEWARVVARLEEKLNQY